MTFEKIPHLKVLNITKIPKFWQISLSRSVECSGIKWLPLLFFDFTIVHLKESFRWWQEFCGLKSFHVNYEICILPISFCALFFFFWICKGLTFSARTFPPFCLAQFFRSWYGKINGSSWFLLADLYNVKPTFIPSLFEGNRQSFLFILLTLT